MEDKEKAVRQEPEPAQPSPDPWEAFSLEEGMAKLDEILEKLESPDLLLEEAFGLYQQGVGLLRHCSGRIDMVEKKVLMMNEEGGLDEF